MHKILVYFIANFQYFRLQYVGFDQHVHFSDWHKPDCDGSEIFNAAEFSVGWWVWKGKYTNQNTEKKWALN